jgi:hypothetical protein
MRKRAVLVRIDEELYKKLWGYIKAAYPGSVYGALSVEVQNAIAHWLNEKSLTMRTFAAHTNAHMSPSIPRTQHRIGKLVNWLRGKTA